MHSSLVAKPFLLYLDVPLYFRHNCLSEIKNEAQTIKLELVNGGLIEANT